MGQWRVRGFWVGCSLVVVGGLALAVAATREPRWMWARTFHEGAVWTYGGIAMASTAILLLLCGRGWRRAVLEVAAFVELYWWFSWLMFAVQMR